jgi:hypothetical protein
MVAYSVSPLKNRGLIALSDGAVAIIRANNPMNGFLQMTSF